MEICVSNLCGAYCVDPVEGERLCTEAASALSQGGPVSLNFTGVSVLTSAFLNAALGCLYRNLGCHGLDGRLIFSGLDSIDQALVDEVRVRAARFYAASPQQQNELAASSSHSVQDA